MDSRARIGRLGEDAACDYLSSRGHSILERNWRTGRLEVDIISLDRRGLHFVEVKSRVAPQAAAPQENVRRTKQRNLARAAERYLMTKGRSLGDIDVVFDVVSVLFEGGRTDVEYLPEAFLPIMP